MNPPKHIEEEVAQTMHSLDGVERAQTDAFFYSRLESRLEQEREPRTIFASLWAEPRYLVAAAAIMIVIIFNIFSIAEYQQYYGGETIQQAEVTEVLAEEFELNVPVWYDTNEEQNGY